MTSAGTAYLYSLIVPVRDDEAALPQILGRLERIMDRLDGPAEVVFVDDGSRDSTPIVLAARVSADPRLRYVRLDRPYGRKASVTAGLEAASGAAMIILEKGLDEEPDVILALAERWREGHGIVAVTRPATGWRRLLGRLPLAPRSEVRLVDRRIFDVWRALPAAHRDAAWVEGVPQAVVPIAAPSERLRRGRPRSNPLAGGDAGPFPESAEPLRFALGVGLAVMALSLASGLGLVAAGFGNGPSGGLQAAMLAQTGVLGIAMTVLGFAGFHVARLSSPGGDLRTYVIGHRIGFDRPAATPLAAPAETPAEAPAVVADTTRAAS
ncbi:glycosyltransferase [Prosthecomicrobium sp. N25]|uniref:glycosyltransferase n=1 Tax=Prosthecomicrobium sp. N25 TaxID=3129254 RepID=UPI003076B26D